MFIVRARHDVSRTPLGVPGSGRTHGTPNGVRDFFFDLGL
jgi:hypothetical protein